MDMALKTMTTATANVATETSPAIMVMETAAATMSMGTDGCKLSMLLNWHTIDACFLSSAFRIRSSFAFLATCFSAFLLVISLEFLRRLQRDFDRYLLARHAKAWGDKYSVAEDVEEKKLLDRDGKNSQAGKGKAKITVRMVLEQIARAFIYMLQFGISYCIMLMVMSSNGYIIISSLLGALAGFAAFTRDTLYSRIEMEDALQSSMPGHVC